MKYNLYNSESIQTTKITMKKPEEVLRTYKHNYSTGVDIIKILKKPYFNYDTMEMYNVLRTWECPNDDSVPRIYEDYIPEHVIEAYERNLIRNGYYLCE
jgi:hypothetical protein